LLHVAVLDGVGAALDDVGAALDGALATGVLLWQAASPAIKAMVASAA